MFAKWSEKTGFQKIIDPLESTWKIKYGKVAFVAFNLLQLEKQNSS
jgi:hypothetical protein